MRLFRSLLAAALFGAAPLVAIQSASAAPPMADSTLGKIGTSVETIQYRHPDFRHHGGGWRHERGYGYNGGYRRYDGGYYGNGPAVLGGLAAGAIIGSEGLIRKEAVKPFAASLLSGLSSA